MSNDRLEQAVALLREIRDEAEARRQHFGNINDINFEPGIATDAKKQIEAIDAFLDAAPAPEPEPDAETVAEIYAKWDAVKTLHREAVGLLGRWAGTPRPPSIADSEPEWAEGFDGIQGETINWLLEGSKRLEELNARYRTREVQR